MQWFKFSLFIFLSSLMANTSAAKFSSSECLNSRFTSNIKHDGKFFGLLKNNLTINKDKCKIDVVFKGILETVWKVDICREPIHMKVTSKGSQNVYKRTKACSDDIKTDFCYFRNELMENIQDHGLIFAEGERELLKSSHGQTYCTFLLLQRYLDDGYVFSAYENPKNIYEPQQSCELPVATVDKPLIEPIEQPVPTPVTSKPMQPIFEEQEATSSEEGKPRF